MVLRRSSAGEELWQAMEELLMEELPPLQQALRRVRPGRVRPGRECPRLHSRCTGLQAAKYVSINWHAF